MEAWVTGGKNGAILALDTQEVSAEGHATTYPSGQMTVAVEVPLSEARQGPLLAEAEEVGSYVFLELNEMKLPNRW